MILFSLLLSLEKNASSRSIIWYVCAYTYIILHIFHNSIWWFWLSKNVDDDDDDGDNYTDTVIMIVHLESVHRLSLILLLSSFVLLLLLLLFLLLKEWGWFMAPRILIKHINRHFLFGINICVMGQTFCIYDFFFFRLLPLSPTFLFLLSCCNTN